MQRAQMDRRAIEQEVTALNADLAETEMRWRQDIHHRTGLVNRKASPCSGAAASVSQSLASGHAALKRSTPAASGASA